MFNVTINFTGTSSGAANKHSVTSRIVSTSYHCFGSQSALHELLMVKQYFYRQIPASSHDRHHIHDSHHHEVSDALWQRLGQSFT